MSDAAKTDKSEAGDVDGISPSAKVYQAMVDKLLTAAYDRRTKMETRGSTIVTANSALLTLVFGLTVVVTGKDYKLSSGFAVAALLLSLLAFVVSAVLGIWVQSKAIGYTTTDPAALKGLVSRRNFWDDSVEQAVREATDQQINTIASLDEANKRKDKWVTGSLRAQLAAICFLVVAICFELAARMGFSLHGMFCWVGDLLCWFAGQC